MVVQGVTIYNYEGKMISNPKILSIKFEFLNYFKISISPDILAIIDGSSNKIVRFFEVLTGK